MRPTLRILLVEDDLRTARRLAGMLEEDGYEVDLAHDAATAIAHLGADGPLPDVVVTDLMLHGASGLTVVAQARELKPDVGVIFVTGYPNLLPHVPRGACPPTVFTKPLSYGALHAALDRFAPADRQAGSS